MIAQQEMIAALRDVREKDTRVEAAMLYGSFAHGEGDEFSDLDVILYIDSDALRDIEPRAWIEQIRAVALYYVNDFGVSAVIFDNLVRGEFHFDPVAKMDEMRSWVGTVSFPSPEKTILVDRHGKLREILALLKDEPQYETPEQRQQLANNFVNWFLAGLNTLSRGDAAQAYTFLSVLQRILLQMLRLSEAATQHWIAPHKQLARELPPELYARIVACTATMEREQVWDAYEAAWALGKEWIEAQVTFDAALLASLAELLKTRRKEKR